MRVFLAEELGMLNVWRRHADEQYFLIAPDEEDNYREVFRIYVEGGEVIGALISAFTYTEKKSATIWDMFF